MTRTAAKTSSPKRTTNLQIGVTGAIAELNTVADYLSKGAPVRRIFGVDTFGHEKSILEGEHFDRVPMHKATPPSVNQSVDLAGAPPQLHQPIGYLYIANPSKWKTLEPIRADIVKDTVVVTTFEVLNEMADAWDLTMLPTFYHEDWIAVKIC